MRERMAAAVSDPLLLATDEAERLVVDGMPFRDAHEKVASAVREGTLVARGSPAESVRRRGAPGPGAVRESVSAARARLASSP